MPASKMRKTNFIIFTSGGSEEILNIQNLTFYVMHFGLMHQQTKLILMHLIIARAIFTWLFMY